MNMLLHYSVLIGSGILVALQPFGGPPPVASVKEGRDRIIARLKELDLPDGPIVDLGAGWGGVAEALVEAFPDREIIALEQAPIQLLFLRLRAKVHGYKVVSGNGFKLIQSGSIRPAAIVSFLNEPLMIPFADLANHTRAALISLRFKFSNADGCDGDNRWRVYWKQAR